MARGEEWTAIPDAVAVSDGLVLIVEVSGVRYGVPRHHVAPDSEVRRPGERGVLRVSRRYADEAGFTMRAD